MKKLMHHVKPLANGYFNPTFPDGCISYQVMFKFWPERQAQLARDRMLQEQKGGDWPPFAVVLGTPEIVLSMSRRKGLDRAGQGRAGQGRAEQGRAGAVRAGQSRARNSMAGQGTEGPDRAGCDRTGPGRPALARER